MATHCFVFCPRPLEGAPAGLAQALDDAFILAVDGGLRHLRKTGFEPEVWVGDGDSLKAKKLAGKYPKLRLPRAKNYSDLEFALHVAGRAFLEGDWDGDVVLLGAQGGRFDHDLTNLVVAQRFLNDLAGAVGPRSCPEVYSYGPHGLWLATAGEVRFKQPRRAVFSVLALDAATKISITGARYNARAAAFEHGSRGLSNEGMGRTVKVSVTVSGSGASAGRGRRRSHGVAFVFFPTS